MEFTHNYKSYEDYLNFQKQKTLDPRRQKKWKTIEWRKKIDIFKKVFLEQEKLNWSSFKNGLCLGSRTGQEVVAFKELGVNEALGIDIVPFEPYTVLGDIHDLNYKDESFDILFTNIFDHSINPKKFISEMQRVCQKGGYILLHLQMDCHQDSFTEVVINNLDIVKNLFVGCELVMERNIDTGIIAMNYELLFKKN